MHLIGLLFGKVLIPLAVKEEILSKEDIQEKKLAKNNIVVEKVNNKELVQEIIQERNLDIGESEAIVLAIEKNAPLLLIDERKGRTVARDYNLFTIGVLGVFEKAKKMGHIKKVMTHIQTLIDEHDFRISQQLLELFKERVNE